MRIPYGYVQLGTGQIAVSPQQAETIRLIYNLYLQGKSLGGIANILKSQNISSPTGKGNWTRATIDKILSNGKYIPSVITEEQFRKAQIEKEHRTNMNDNGRKTARYNSQNVLSGLLICGECSCNYRRITRSSGEIVWRCADKVENGKQSNCSNSKTISDNAIKQIVCEQLGMESFDEDIVRNMIDAIVIDAEEVAIQVKPSLTLNFAIL